jgi:hypothetical protein
VSSSPRTISDIRTDGIRTVVGVPMYKNLGTHVTLSILGGISAIIVPIPYLLYFFGAKLRKRSKYAISR